MSTALTNNQIDKAGRTIRAWMRGKSVLPEEVDAALEILLRFRAVHQYPLGKATMG